MMILIDALRLGVLLNIHKFWRPKS